GETGTLQAVLTISNLDGTTERADAHAIRVRLKPTVTAARAVVMRLAHLARGRELHAQSAPPRPAPSGHIPALRGGGAAGTPQECDHGSAPRR
ncbi:MAG TPA: hypothetical protein VF981_03640, partial [Gemmatimonadaceae bacterium]